MFTVYLKTNFQLSDATGSGKSKVAASKPDIGSAQLAHKITTKFKRQYLCFLGLAMQWELCQCCTANRKKPEMENPRWRPLNLKYVHLSLYSR